MRDKNEKGVITVFLALVFGLLLTFLINLVNVTMVNSAKNQMIIASDAAITSALAGYDRDLFSDYGLLSFEENSDMITALNKIFMENLNGNAGLNGMFNYDGSENKISAVTGGNIFEENQLMKKQMIYSMKYQGTENLLLGVFDKIKEFTNSKEVIEESEKLQEVDEKVGDIEEEIEKMQKAKRDAASIIVELAKNNNYEILGQGNIGYIYNIEDIKSFYPGNDTIAASYDAMEIGSYNPRANLPRMYSYAYTILILEMYKDYLSILVEEQNAQGNTNFGESINVYQIDQLIKELESRISDEKDNLVARLGYYIDDLIDGKNKVEDLINTYDRSVQPILDSYKEIANNSQNADIKKNAEDSYNSYNILLSEQNLENVKNDFTKVVDKYNYVVNNLDQLVNNLLKIKTDYSGLISTDWVRNNKDNSVFEEMDMVIGKRFNWPPDVENFVQIICNNKKFKELSKETNILEIQLTTIEKEFNINDSTKMDKPEPESDKFKEFFKMFKKFKEEKSKINIQGKSEKSITPVNPVNTNNESNNNEGTKLSEQINQVESEYNLDLSTSIINSGAGFLDKLYLVEYIMTNFKDRSSEFSNPDYSRIPEMRKSPETKLDYEIETIISQKYNDKDSSTTLVDDFFAMRMALNTISLMTKQSVLKDFINDISLIISTATGGFVPAPVARVAITLGWATLETTYDIIDIFNGYSVPVFKEGFEDWVTDFGLSENVFTDIDIAMSGMKKENYEPTKKHGEAYNNQENNFSLNYTDMMRFKLLIIDSNKIIDGSQNLIIENKELREKYNNYKSNMEISVDKSKLNILFNTDVFSSEQGHKFNRFSFKKGYN